LSHPILDGNGVKTMPGRLKYPILVHSIIEKKENTGSQMGHTKKEKEGHFVYNEEMEA